MKISEALLIIRSLQKEIFPLGFCIGLTGSILIKGYSNNDLDIIVYPFNSGSVNLKIFWKKLFDLGWKRVMTRSQVAVKWEKKSFDMKNVEKWRTPEGINIDIFYLK